MFPTSRHRTVFSSILLLALCTLGSACSTSPPNAAEPALGAVVAPQQDDSLFRALGGNAGIKTLTTDFIRALAADERIREQFRDTDIPRFHTLLQEQFCKISGGGCEYTGDSMTDSHAGLGISRSDFNATVEALMKAMDKNGIAVGAQNRLLAALAPMHSDIVED